MRIWSISPAYLDWRGLGALWRETLLAQKVLQGRTRGWRSHPQLDRFRSHPEPLGAVGMYLAGVHEEALMRGYRYDRTKILLPDCQVDRIPVTQGQLSYEFKVLNERLLYRDPAKHAENLAIETVLPHPSFRVLEGPPEPWERGYWRGLPGNS